MEARWQPDILGDGYEQQTIPLRSEVEGVDGAPVATLIRHLPRRRRLFQKRRMFEDVDVLYVHGWSDYFFQKPSRRVLGESRRQILRAGLAPLWP